VAQQQENNKEIVMAKKKEKIDHKQIANFLFEVGILDKTPRSGFHFLGTGNQTVAEHVNRVCFIGYIDIWILISFSIFQLELE
jgi:hypothetical protein